MTDAVDRADDPRGEEVSPLPRELLDAWAWTWTNRREPYALQQEDGTYRWVYAPCDTTVLAAHLAGATTIALSCTDDDGQCRWVCLDADQVDALPRLRALADALLSRGLPALVEASRRGGHMWLLLDEPMPAAILRRVVLHLLDELCADGLEIPALEIYPDAAAESPGALGHAVRLPLGIHRLTGKRYALFDERGYPVAFTSTEAAHRFIKGWPRVASAQIAQYAQTFGPRESSTAPDTPQRTRMGTHSPVIRWVDASASPLALLADLVPESAMRQVGRGYLGWCPFHDDEAPDAAGKPGTPLVLRRPRSHAWLELALFQLELPAVLGADAPQL